MRYTFAPDVRRFAQGRVLLGGSPMRILRLSDSGSRVADRLGSGAPLDGEPTRSEAQFAARLVRLGFLEPHAAVGEGPWGPGDVTVVVPTRDRADRLADALAAITKDPDSAPARIVVVDDGSIDGSAVAEVAARHGAEVIVRPTSGGPSAARNTGLSAVRTPLVAFVDSDVTVGPGWLPWLVRTFADPDVALAAPRILSAERGDLRAQYESARSPLNLGARPGPVVARSRLSYVPAATLLGRVDALAAVGGFDETLTVGEDVDLCWRLADAGHLVWFAGEEAWVTHDDQGERSTWFDWARRRFDYGTSAAPLDQRHRGHVAPLGVSGWSAVVWGAVALGHPVVGATVAAGTSAALVRKLDFLDDPREVAGLAWRGNVGAGELIGRALIRPWFPFTLVAGLVSRRARRVAVAAAVVPHLLEWQRRRPSIDPVRWTLLSVADDVAYSAGVWAGSIRARSYGALRPDLHDWPGTAADRPTDSEPTV